MCPNPRRTSSRASPYGCSDGSGLLAYGGVHLVLAAVIVQVPFGEKERADKKGALEEIAETTPGLVLLWLVTLGLVALVLWQLGEAIWGHRTVHGGTRALRVAINLAEAALFGVLAWSAGSIAAKGGSSTPSKPFTEVVIGLPGGPVLIGLAGVGLVIGACYAVYRGVTSAFLRELDLSGASPAADALGHPAGSDRLGGARAGVRVPRRAVHRRGDDVQPGNADVPGLRAPHGRGRALRAAADRRARPRPGGVRRSTASSTRGTARPDGHPASHSLR